MSLLPFSAWAEITIDNWPTYAAGAVYNGEAHAVIATAGTAGGNGVCTFYYAVTQSTIAPDAEDDIWKTDIADASLKATNAGMYYAWFKIESTDANEHFAPTSFAGSFEITKAVASNPTAPTGATALTYNGAAQALLTAAATPAAGTGTAQYKVDNGNWQDAIPTAINAKTSYRVYYRATGSDNYSASTGESYVDVAIAQKELNVTNFTVTREDASAIYNGAVQNSPYVVTFTTPNPNETLDLNEDYELSYKDAGENAANPKNYGTYTATITGKGNFSGTITTAQLNTLTTGLGNWDITKKPITVVAKPQSKPYDGNTTLPSEAPGTAYDIVGVVGEENVGAPTLTVAAATVGDQAITPSALNGDAGVLANYNPTYVPSTLTIDPIKLTISVDQTNDVTKRNKGEDAPSLANLQAALVLNATDYDNEHQPAIVGTEAPTIKGAITMAIADNTFEAEATTAGTFAITLTKTDAAVLNNYTITLQNGTFTVYGGQVTITTLPKSRNYIGTDFDWATAEENEDYIVSGLTGNDKVEGITLSCNTGEGNVGEYDIDATWTSVPEWYQVVVVKGKYSIEPQEIEITVKDQTLLDGQALDQTAYEIKSGEKKSTDNWDEIFKLDYVDAAWADAQGKAKATAAGSYNEGIKVTLLDGVTNYALVAGQGKGKLTILDQAITLYLDRADDLATRIHAAAEYCEANELNTYNVTFATRDLKAETWQAMAFPFDLTVAEFNNKIYTATGAYAVVNILGDPKDGKPSFKLWMREIPANTPFLFKIYNGKTGETLKNFDLVNLTFNGVKIVEDEAKAADSDGNEFYGIYAPTVVTNDEHTWLFNHNKGTFQKYTGTSRTLAPLTGYLKTANDIDAFARIFVEDFDGTVTAISGINVDAKTVNAEGVYNLNGMKMKDAPTQKGVYIVNGKKVVIK